MEDALKEISHKLEVDNADSSLEKRTASLYSNPSKTALEHKQEAI